MNRRDFLGAMAGGIAAANLNSSVLFAEAPSTATAASEDTVAQAQGAWVQGGLIDAGGTHEPYNFLIRRGGESLDTRRFCDFQQSEEVIRKLHEQGVEIFHTHFYKGFGIAAERPYMEETARAAAIAHRYGMKVDTYVQWNSLMYETFFQEEPRAKNWIQRDALGQPVMLAYGYQQSFRYRPCFSNQEYLDYLKRVVRLAIEEAKTDFIHFDNFDLNSEPYSCHCQQCIEGFRKRLNTKYSPEQRKERFGFSNIDQVTPPLWNQGNPPEQMEIIYDPAFQEWIDYRCQTMADALGQIAAYMRSLNPNIAVEVNCNGIDGGNHPWADGVDWRRVLPHTQVFWAEAQTRAAYFPDGRLVSSIRTYKMARAYENTAFTYIADNEASIGESLAFNHTLGFAGEYPLHPEIVKYIGFYRKHRDFYLGAKDVAPIAVLRSYPSIAYNNPRCNLGAILTEQSLIQSRAPFRLIFDEALRELDSTRLKVLILPESECLSDGQIGHIRTFVEAGGGLVAIGRAGLYDSWRRLRVKPGLAGLIGEQAPAPAYEEEVMASHAERGESAHRELGRGRTVYLPGLEFDGPLPKMEPFFPIGTKFWKRPKNWEQLVDAVTWTAAGNLPLHVGGPDFLAANLVEQAGKRRRVLHLVNYNWKTSPTVENIPVKCALAEGTKIRSVRLYSADLAAPQSLDFHAEGAQAVFTIPSIKTYAFAAVEWA